MNYERIVSVSADTLREMKKHGIEPDQRLVLSVEFQNGKIMDFCMEAEAYDEIDDISLFLRENKTNSYFKIFAHEENDYDNVDFDVIFDSWRLEFQGDTYTLNIREGNQTEDIVCHYDYGYGKNFYNHKGEYRLLWNENDTVKYDSDCERSVKRPLLKKKHSKKIKAIFRIKTVLLSAWLNY